MDLLSSPDPLNESVASSVAPYARRVTRSQTSSRYASLEAVSPRKQTFHLDVGDEISPQKIRVTVEAESDKENNISRRLFTSPTPKRVIRTRGKATTTTIPLKGLSDEGNGLLDRPATPRRRGRPPRSGTPAASTRKRAATPAKKSARKPRKTGPSESDALDSEASMATDQTTPRPTRTRSAVKRKRGIATTEEGGLLQDTLPKRRGRPRRKSIVPEDIVILADADSAANARSPDGVTLDSIEVSSPGNDGPEQADKIGSNADMGVDIWMATLSDAPTPVARRVLSRHNGKTDASVSTERPTTNDDPSDSADSVLDGADYGGYMDMDNHSDLESVSQVSVGTRRDQDTVVDGENFTMISMNSVPSFQANIHVPTSDLPEIGETTSLIINKTLESLRQSQAEVDEDDNISLDDGDRTPKANSSADTDHAPASQQSGTPRLSTADISPIPLSRSPRRKAKPLGRQLALKSLKKDARLPQGDSVESEALPQVGGSQTVAASRSVNEDEGLYEDSFSEIPEAVLEAATPRRIPEHHIFDEGPEEQPEREAGNASMSRSPHSQAGSSRMLTPDDTPSPLDEDETPAQKDRSDMIQLATSEPRSSPPVFALKPQDVLSTRRSEPSFEGTPVAAPSSPHLPPSEIVPSQGQSLAAPSTASRPTLSPIVRAGRTLQNIISDPPSPSSRGSVLGSPFRSSVRGSSPPAAEETPMVKNPSPTVPDSLPAQQTESSWSKAFAPLSHLKNLVVQGAQVFSPRGISQQNLKNVFEASRGTSSKFESDDMQAAFSRTQEPKLEEPSHETPAGSTMADIPSEDEMSWVADAGHPAPGINGSFNSTTSSVFASRGSNSLSVAAMELDDGLEVQVDTVMSEQEANDNEVDDEDIWAIEARRPTPVSSRAQKARDAVFNSGRRRPLPRAWKDTTTRSVAKPLLAADMEEYSLLALDDGDDTRLSQKEAQSQSKRREKANLSAFFSSSPNGLLGGGPFERPATRGTDLFQTANPTWGASKPQRVQDSEPSVPQKEFRPSNHGTAFLFPSALHSQHSEGVDTAPPSHSSSPATPERPAISHIPQKRNFTPLLGQSKASLFKPSPAPTSNTLRFNQARVLDARVAEENDIDPDLSFERPDLKPLPPRHASPSKSCLRSPLKPKTPGRVVEFSGNALSPLAQAQERAMRRSQASLPRPVSFQEEKNEDRGEGDKENGQMGARNTANTLPILSTPKHRHLHAAAPADSPLSQTTWTRKHWLRLDELLQQCRSAPLEFQLRHGSVTPQRRTSHKLLGKQVAAQGEAMILEQWHLDIVDAFRREVGGWNETALAKRLFALIIGEARRKAGLVPRREKPSVLV
ncbi:hypothetical protein NKR23_g7651 [Pleurostoma richardsiae]|uniref:Uncharacterized protein n=1 Tax=Pleurostoma richardsiae TaxID=41990 RepID=A0AA38RHN7_9PEZI|nr:hypothetical protein NKR23_g7651 [Pleurostoma richardsiae]